MTHDPLCRISKAIRDGECCADDPLFGYPCDCRLITEVRQDMLAKCIAAVEAIGDGGDADTRYILASTAATLRALQEQP